MDKLPDEVEVNVNTDADYLLDLIKKVENSVKAQEPETTIKDPDIDPTTKKKEIVWEDFEELSENFNKGLPWLR